MRLDWRCEFLETTFLTFDGRRQFYCWKRVSVDNFDKSCIYG